MHKESGIDEANEESWIDVESWNSSWRWRTECTWRLMKERLVEKISTMFCLRCLRFVLQSCVEML